MAEYKEPFGGFPDLESHARRWQDLAAAIAAGAPPRDPDGPHGELTVIGSGIEACGFTMADETLIRDADEVLFCVADPATCVWIKALRPDAYDLYVLYDDGKPRYMTYMQMSEAMLHFTRLGRRVVAIFYGHPGVFVLSTHRAIAIARREGHRAVMRAAVSALDTLCADIGIDPSQPGLQTFEATDMLIRRRPLDTCVHVVLWQVGLIGELGYRRKGFLNEGFSYLLDYLEAAYGPSHPVVNYVGSRYPGIDPLTDRQTISAFRDPRAQASVTGISTFYLPPKDVAPVDESTLLRLGLLPPGGVVKTPASPLREIDAYGPRERRAVADLSRFRVPAGYHWQEDTAGARFVLALRDERSLRDRYATDPAGTVADWGGASLAVRERALMGRREAGALQIAAKGVRPTGDGARDEAHRLLTSTVAARGLLRGVREAAEGTREKTVPDGIEHALDQVLGQTLYPWTGLYLVQGAETSLFIIGSTRLDGSGRVFLNGVPLTGIRYAEGTLRWRSPGSEGHLRSDVSPKGARRLIGAIWPAGEVPGSAHQVGALEHLIRSAEAPSEVPSWALPHVTAVLADAERRHPGSGEALYTQHWRRAGSNLRTVRAALREARREPLREARREPLREARREPLREAGH